MLEPEREITRAEFLAIVLMVHNIDVSKTPATSPFKDVTVEWHKRVVKA